jgi:hypothetical protein
MKGVLNTFSVPATVGFLLVSQSVGVGAATQRWTTYKSNVLALQVSVPSDWTPAKTQKALAFRYDDQAGGTAGVGFLKSTKRGLSIQRQADQEFQREGSAAGWKRSSAVVAGMPAIKMTGTSHVDPTHKLIHYFVQTPSGVYLIQCQGSADRWTEFGPIFATILSKLKFLSSAPPGAK